MIFRWPGGKSKKSILNKIKSLFPKDYSEYREPFVGGGSVYFSVGNEKIRWINDKDEDLISVYLTLRDNCNEFIKECRTIPSPKQNEELCENNKYNKRLKQKFNELVNSSNSALKYYFINRTGWAGRVRYDLPSRLYYSNPNGWKIIDTNKLEVASYILQDTRITATDYAELISAPGDNVFIYIDPPYYVNTLLAKTSQLYRHNFTIEDHEKLCYNLSQSNHKILISYDNCEFIKNLYKNWNIIEEEWTYCGTSSAKGLENKTKKIGKELLIKNY
jgi:DNA adenine methylase